MSYIPGWLLGESVGKFGYELEEIYWPRADKTYLCCCGAGLPNESWTVGVQLVQY